MNEPSLKEARKRRGEELNINIFNLDPKYLNLGVTKKYMLKTYGCQGNLADSEKIAGMLELMGFEKTENELEADFVLFNTCAIRENAEERVFGELGRFQKFKKKKPDMIIGVCGCMPQEEKTIKTIKKKCPQVNIVFGTHNIASLPEYLYDVINEQKKVIEVLSVEGDIYENLPIVRDHPKKAWVNIMYGCDKFCTYCIVPYTRGTQRSRKHEDIVSEVETLVKDGYKEVTLLGQNVNAYGKDLYDNYNLADLLKDVSDTGIERIRFVTSHPWDFTDSMVDIIASRDNIMPYIHLPLQSGSNKILKLMNRKYTSEEYLKLYNSIRDKVKDSSVTTDIIVGFPGETEEDFEETLKIVNECKFDGAFTFAYSPRENTPAALMKDAIRESVKMDRLHRLNEVVNKYSNLRNQKLLGKTVKCLVIGESEKDKNKVCGYTENMKLVNIEGPKSLIGSIVPVKITDTKSFSLDGEYIKEKEE